MKKYYLPVIILTVWMGSSHLSAETISWLDGGSVVHTTEPKELNSSLEQPVSKSVTRESKVVNEVKLATGEAIILIGGVYAKAKDPDGILDWAGANGYEAVEDKYTKGAVHIETSIEQSLSVAKAISQLEGVTTSAPKFKRKLISK